MSYLILAIVIYFIVGLIVAIKGYMDRWVRTFLDFIIVTILWVGFID